MNEVALTLKSVDPMTMAMAIDAAKSAIAAAGVNDVTETIVSTSGENSATLTVTRTLHDQNGIPQSPERVTLNVRGTNSEIARIVTYLNQTSYQQAANERERGVYGWLAGIQTDHRPELAQQLAPSIPQWVWTGQPACTH